MPEGSCGAEVAREPGQLEQLGNKISGATQHIGSLVIRLNRMHDNLTGRAGLEKNVLDELPTVQGSLNTLDQRIGELMSQVDRIESAVSSLESINL